MPAADEAVYMGLPHERYLRPRFWSAALLGVPVVVLAMGEMIAPEFFHRFDARLLAWLQLVLTTPIFFWAGAPLNQRWWVSIRDRSTNMFTLIVSGTAAAYLYSVAAVLFGDYFPATLGTEHGVPLYFEAVAFITAIVLLGHARRNHDEHQLDFRYHERAPTASRAPRADFAQYRKGDASNAARG